MQRRHSVRHLFWRSGVAAVSQAMMFSGVYPLIPHAVRAFDKIHMGTRPLRAALAEWAMAMAVSPRAPPASRLQARAHGAPGDPATRLRDEPRELRRPRTASRAGLGPILA
jgi:hypothetical protein